MNKELILVAASLIASMVTSVSLSTLLCKGRVLVGKDNYGLMNWKEGDLDRAW